MNTNRVGGRAAFTLVELLTVVAIIGLLVAVLVPALTAARKKAKTTICAANLHQLGLGTETYFTENRCYPPHKWKTPDGVNDRWPSAVSLYLRSEKLLVCPLTPQWIVGRNNSYGYNYKYLGSLRFNDRGETPPYEMFPVKHVPSASRTIAYADSDGTGWTRPYEPDGTTVEAIGNHGYTLDPTFVPTHARFTVNNEGEQEEFAYLTHRSYISTRHQNRSNAVFTDGHAELVTPRRVYRDNQYWNGLGVEDSTRDPHVDYRVGAGTFRFAADIQ